MSRRKESKGYVKELSKGKKTEVRKVMVMPLTRSKESIGYVKKFLKNL